MNGHFGDDFNNQSFQWYKSLVFPTWLRVSECVEFNVPLDTSQVIIQMSLSRQLIPLVPTTKNNETKHHTHFQHKIETEKNCFSYENKLHPGLLFLI